MLKSLKSTNREQIARKCILALAVAAVLSAVAMTPGLSTVFASGSAIDTGNLKEVVQLVVDIIKIAAIAIGAIIAVWGVFQLILSLRREDSEGIGKQITTIVIGVVLCGFGAFITKILGALAPELGIG